MSGKLKANYSTGETQVLLPFEFHDLKAEIRQELLKGWINSLIKELNLCAAPAEEVAEAQDEPLPPHDKVAEPQVEEKPKRGRKPSK
jgi:hypothetical protein